MEKTYRKILLVLFTVIALVCTGQTIAYAGTSAVADGPINLIGSMSGRYELNYTGNTNHFDQWDDHSEVLYVSRNFKDRKDIASENNSTGMLTAGAQDARIARAFLIWETRASSGVNTPIRLYTSKSGTTYHSVSADVACVDTRTDPSGSWSYNSLYCMAADVTDIVQAAGYGAYTVANIPVWQKTVGAVDYNTGGESVASWQLIIVEESESYSVRYIRLDMASKFYLAQDFTFSMRSAIPSKTSGIVNGQIFYGTSNSGMNVMTENYETYDKNGNPVGSGVSNTTSQAGLYKNSTAFNKRDQGVAYTTADGTRAANGTIRMSLSDIKNIGNDVTRLRMRVENDGWTTTFIMGMCYDINMYTVSYDGNGAPSGWTERTTCLFDKDYTINANGFHYKYHKFIGWNTKADGSGQWWYPGDTYKNLCTVPDGDYKLYAQWETLGAMITLDNQGADIEAGTPKYFEKYNDRNYTDDDCIIPIDSIVIPKKTGYVFDGYYTGKNGTGTKYVDKTGNILSTSTTFTRDTTLYAKWEPGVYKITLDNQGARSPGTTCYYEKYGVGNYADAACTVPITNITLPEKRGHAFAGYWTEPEGNGTLCVTTAGATCTRENQFTKDTTIYANWTPKTFTITCDNQGATFGGSSYFNELYGKSFYYSATVLTSGTTALPYNYTGDVQYFVAPYTGTYTLQVWGAQGGTISHSGDGYAYATGTGGNGGFSQGDIYLAQGEILYIYVGGAGSDISGGYNGGGYASGWSATDQCMAGGGGATDIRRYGTAYENRIIIAGGGGGGAIYMNTGIPGGAGGGTDWTTTYCNHYNNHGVVSKNTNPVNIARTYGYSAVSGGGGGAYGGGGYDYGLVVTSGEGGIGYIGGVVNGNSVAGVRNGNGYAVVTRNNCTTQYTATTRIEPPTKEGYTFMGYYTGVNGTGQQIVDARGNIVVSTDYFESNATVYAYWIAGAVAIPDTYVVHFNGNGATSGTMESMICNVGQTYQLRANRFGKTNYVFAGWATSPNGNVVYSDGQRFHQGTFGASAGSVITLYAVWRDAGYTLTVNPNGGTWNGSTSTQNFTLIQGNTKMIAYPTRAGYTFAGWTLTGAGSSINDTTFKMGTENATLTANWTLNNYKVNLIAGNGIANVTGDGTYPYNSNVNISATLSPGYHWKNWTGTYDSSDINYSFRMPANNVTMTANAEANNYTIVFNPNDGKEVTPLEDIVTQYDADISLPDVILDDGTHAYVKYTLDGVDITDQVLAQSIVLAMDGTVVYQGEPLPEGSSVAADGTITYPDGTAVSPNGIITSPDGIVTYPDGNVVYPDGTVVELTKENSEELGTSGEESESSGESEEAPAERAEVLDTEPQADKKAYASVFMGWSLAENKGSYIPEWKAGEVLDTVSLADAAGVTDLDGATIILYAVWDDCPWIQATDLYYTLEQAQSGFITVDEILSHATASDREDGSPIAPGFHENGTSFSIPDYLPTDFTQFKSEGSSTENLTVVDSSGSVYAKQITVYVVDTTPVAVEPEGTTRFINEYYYNQPYEYGGLEDNSIWKTDPEYVAALQMTFDNIKNDTSVQTYYFTHEDILAMKEFIAKNGIGNTRYDDALQRFYNQFMEPKLVQ